MTCEHCEKAVGDSVSAVEGVERVDVDLATKMVTVVGKGLEDTHLRRAISDAGYEAA